MNHNFVGLILTLIVGLSFLIGFLITKIFNNKEKIINISMGIAATVLIGIMFFDLIPEVLELFADFNLKYFLFILFLLVGFFFLLVLDKKIPHHDDHNDKDDHNHLYHISVITTISLILHNFIEGSAIYSVALTNIEAAILMTIGVMLHNIPLGMITVSSIYGSKEKNRNLFLFLLIISSFLGGITLFIFNRNISSYVLGSLISITLGMTIYIVFFELLKEIYEEDNKKDCFVGMIIGILLIIVSLFI